MKRNLPPLPSVRVFEAAARHRSFTRAAAELGMTQAAVSYQIRLLEERIGVPLFVRAGKRVHLSEAGERLAPTMSEVLDLLASAFDEVAGRSHGTLNLCVIPTFASNWLAQRMGRFQDAHPRLSVRLSTSRHCVDVRRSEIDAAIAVGTGDWPGLESHELVKADITPMLSPQLSQRIGGLREPKDLLRCPLINPTDALWTLWFAAAGVERPVPGEEDGSNMGSQHLEGLAAAAGQGAAILTPFFHAESLAAGRLIQPFDLVCSSGKSYWLCYPSAHRNSLKIRAFRDWLLTELATCKVS